MGKTNNFIEINGKRYNARTGETLSVNGPHARAQAAAKVNTPAVKKPTMSDVVRKPAKHAKAHTPTTAHTLMRHAVKKPAIQPRKHSKATGHTDTLAKRHVGEVVPKQSAKRVDDRLLKKASRVPQSQLIQHFAPVTSDSGTFSQYVAPVAQQTVPTPMPQPPRAATPKPRTTADLLDQALRQATSHHEKPVKPRRKTNRKATAFASIALLIVIAGIIGSQQVPNFRLHLASAKAGFDVSMPDYQPAGYSLGKLSYSTGSAATTFKSNSDSRSYTITQQASAWDSRALRDNFVVQHDKSYQAVESAGQTIYLYGDHNATWVNAGVWYTIQSDGSLSDHQLIQIASTL